MKKKILSLLMGIMCSTAVFSMQKITVSQDGTGDFRSIQQAINSCRHFTYDSTAIYIKNGIYREKVVVPAWITNVSLVGEDPQKTIITNGDYTGKLNAMGEQYMTFTSYTLKVSGDRTRLVNLTIENDAPPIAQAVALHVEADGVFVHNCRLLGNQDTVYADGERDQVYIADSYIEGTTDFIFGSARLFIEGCTIHCKRDSYITAASTAKGRDFGFVIHDCKITAAPDVAKVYLGRPWRIYAQTVFLDCEMGRFIHRAGWENWKKPEAEKTTFYGEYNTVGTDTSGRVPWSKQLIKKEAIRYYSALESIRKIHTLSGL